MRHRIEIEFEIDTASAEIIRDLAEGWMGWFPHASHVEVSMTPVVPTTP